MYQYRTISGDKVCAKQRRRHEPTFHVIIHELACVTIARWSPDDARVNEARLTSGGGGCRETFQYTPFHI